MKFGDLTKAEQATLANAQMEGERIQVWDVNAGWCDRHCAKDMKFFPIDTYRIKPEEKIFE